jgi:PHD/YefM family antitoxin component YafN of YafNO toxin-antitoxin module
MDRIPHTMPISDLRSKQAAVLEELNQGPVLLTKQGRAAAVLVHPDYWNQLAALLEELEDIAVAEQRLAEAQEDESVMVSLADAKKELAALGLLDDTE